MLRILSMLAAVLVLSSAGASAVRLQPVVTTGLSGSLCVASPPDGTGRLFIVERSGRVRVARPGESTTSVFLDVSSRVTAKDLEQGLLGLAFHPGYAANGRLFVSYTRSLDGAIVIAEHQRIDADAASPAGRELLVILHPRNGNHNGGMLTFGPDGYLYIGVGDGGAGNDPPNNAQNEDVLLGKILRIDVDRTEPMLGRAYGVPADNPFVGRPGRDEIFATGLRNPWRFSFDRATGALWVGDVGQGAREEVDAPIVAGGNYGWRVHEGTLCTGNDRSLCNGPDYLPPLFEYAHEEGRCSITGGYVYRGARGAVPAGTYVHADFCTGEIFGWDGTSQTLLLDTPLSLSSFGEDEGGELYAVDLNGGVYRLVADVPPTADRAIEYRHAAFGHYFTTAIVEEIDKLDAGVFAGWARTGESFRVSPRGTPGLAGMCRFFGAGFAPGSSHFYTAFASECDIVKRDRAWLFEGEVYALSLPDAAGQCAARTQPLYRLYNDGQGGAPNHRYTVEVATRAAMIAQGWISEGTGELGVIGCVPI